MDLLPGRACQAGWCSYRYGCDDPQRNSSCNGSFSEEEAADALRPLDQRADSLTRLLDNASEDDEPTSSEEDAVAREALEAVGRGEVISAEEIRREFA